MSDARLVLPVAAAWAGAVVGARAPRVGWISAATVLGLVAGALVVGRRDGGARTSPRWIVTAAAVCGGAAVIAAGARADVRHTGVLRDLAARRAEVSLEVVVTGDPVVLDGAVLGARRVAGAVRVPGRAELVAVGDTGHRVRHPVTVLADGRGWRGRLPGERLRLKARLDLPRPGEPVTAIARAHGSPERLAPAGAVQRIAGRIRAGLRDAAASVPGDARGLLPGLVIGDTSRLPDDLRDDFRSTGMSHLVAVSGSNAALFLGFALLLTRRLGGSVRVTTAVGAAALGAFVVIARPSPSVLRAAVMGAIALVALVTGRQRAGLPTLAGAVLVLLLLDPQLARSAGFALSAAATAGLVVLAPRWRSVLARRLPRVLADAIAVPLAAQVACLPILVGLFGELSLTAVPANLLAMPAVGAATAAGVITALLAPVAMPLARLVVLVAALPTWYIAKVARTFARVPASSLPWPSGVSGAAAMIGLLLALPVVWRSATARRVLLVVVPTVVLTSVAGRVLLAGWPPRGWVLVVCDVGQGDGLVLRAGGTHVVIDAGPDPRVMSRCLDRLGVRRVASLVLTHFHADHVEGVPGVLARRDVAEIVVGSLDEPGEERDRVHRWATASGVPLRVARPGESWTLPGATLDVLGPSRPFRGTESDPNNSSLVLLADVEGLRLLLTGDIEQPAQQAVLDSVPPGRLRADVLKVAHHGSSRQLDGFAARVGAAIAVTSVGAVNPYGHPARATMTTLRRLGTRSWRTDRDGDVAVGWREGQRFAVGRGRAAARAAALTVFPAPPPPATGSRLLCRAPPGRRLEEVAEVSRRRYGHSA